MGARLWRRAGIALMAAWCGLAWANEDADTVLGDLGLGASGRQHLDGRPWFFSEKGNTVGLGEEIRGVVALGYKGCGRSRVRIESEGDGEVVYESEGPSVSWKPMAEGAYVMRMSSWSKSSAGCKRVQLERVVVLRVERGRIDANQVPISTASEPEERQRVPRPEMERGVTGSQAMEPRSVVPGESQRRPENGGHMGVSATISKSGDMAGAPMRVKVTVKTTGVAVGDWAEHVWIDTGVERLEVGKAGTAEVVLRKAGKQRIEIKVSSGKGAEGSQSYEVMVPEGSGIDCEVGRSNEATNGVVVYQMNASRLPGEVRRYRWYVDGLEQQERSARLQVDARKMPRRVEATAMNAGGTACHGMY